MLKSKKVSLAGLVALGVVYATPGFAQDAAAAAYKLPTKPVSEAAASNGSFAEVFGTQIHFIEQGDGDPVVFIHGNPTSSYLWRNILPHVSHNGRAIALDLVGMGQSGPAESYRYVDHFKYLEGFIDELELKNVTFVVHDWGAALGFDYARLHPDRVKGIVFMEGVLPPIFPQPSFEAMGPEMGGMFQALKDPAKGREMVIDNNMFVDQILPNFVNRTLGEEAMAAYRLPYLDPKDREPMLEWPREIPIAGEPADVVERMNAIKQFMTTTEKPMLLLYAEPGVLVPPQLVPWYTANIKNIETAFIGPGLHFIQEDQPDAIGRAISDWMRRH